MIRLEKVSGKNVWELPFEVKMPASRLVDSSVLSDAEMDAELEKGYADMKAGRTKSAKSAFADIRKDYGL